MAAMGTEGKVSGQFFLTLGTSHFLGIGSRAGRPTLFLVAEAFRVVVGFLKASNGITDALPQFRQPFWAEQQEHNNQDDEDGSPTVAEHDKPLLEHVFRLL